MTGDEGRESTHSVGDGCHPPHGEITRIAHLLAVDVGDADRYTGPGQDIVPAADPLNAERDPAAGPDPKGPRP